MKLVSKQIIILLTVFGYLYCLFYYTNFFIVGDSFNKLILIIPPAIIGATMGLILGFHSLTFSLYCFIVMLILGQLHIDPYYSSDVGAILPALYISAFVCPSAILSSCLIVGVVFIVHQPFSRRFISRFFRS